MRESVGVVDRSEETPAAVSRGPSSADVFCEAARLHDAGQFAAAEVLLRNAVARDPANSSLRNARGVMFAAMKRHLDAVWCYRDALAYEPAATGVWTNLGNALTQLHHLKAAISCHRRAIALSNGREPLLHHNLGTSLSEAGQYGDAVLAFTRAIELNRDHHMARWDRALAYLYLGNYRQGWADYEIRKVTGQLPAFGLILRFYEIAAEPAQIRHRVAGPFGSAEILRCAKEFNLKARAITMDWTRLVQTPLPALAECRDGSFIVLGKVADDKALVQDPRAGRPQLLTRVDFEERWQRPHRAVDAARRPRRSLAPVRHYMVSRRHS